MPQQVTAIPYFTLLKGAPFKVREPYRYPPPSPFAFGSPNSSNNLVYSEFYCDPVLGNNMNGGSDQNASPSYSTTNGNWNGSSTFIPTDGSNPYFTVTPGQFASVFIDGATTPVYLARVLSAQNAVNGAIVLSTGSAVGVAPTSSATTRSIRVGGAFLGPNGTVGFPMALINFQGATNAAGNEVRINLKNNAVYSVTASINVPAGGVTYQGYSATPGDGGKANIDGGTNAIQLVIGGQAKMFDFIFSNNGTTGSNALVNMSGVIFWRCVFRDCRAIASTSSGSVYIECEFYNWNTSGTANSPAIASFTGGFARYCYFHDSLYSGSSVLLTVANTGGSIMMECIIDSVSSGVLPQASSTGVLFHIDQCSFFNIPGAATGDSGGSTPIGVFVTNCIFAKCGYIFDGASQVSTYHATCYFLNNVYGSGIYAISGGFFKTTGSHTAFETGAITLPPNVSPWVAEATGNFNLSASQALGAGRGVFTQTANNKTGTQGNPDVGAVQTRSALAVAQLTDTTWPNGYVGQVYGVTQLYSGNITNVAISAGSLPPGITLGYGSNSVTLLGTPTTIGTYNFTMQLTVGGSNVVTTYTNHITILASPDSGTGGVGGG